MATGGAKDQASRVESGPRQVSRSTDRRRQEDDTKNWPYFYYLATAGFWLIDVALGANVRAVAFEFSPTLKATYYTACLACALVIRLRPESATHVTLVESSFNVVALFAAFFVTYVGQMTVITEPGTAEPVLSLQFVFNFIIAGAAATLAFHRSRRQVEPSRR